MKSRNAFPYPQSNSSGRQCFPGPRLILPWHIHPGKIWVLLSGPLFFQIYYSWARNFFSQQMSFGFSQNIPSQIQVKTGRGNTRHMQDMQVKAWILWKNNSYVRPKTIFFKNWMRLLFSLNNFACFIEKLCFRFIFQMAFGLCKKCKFTNKSRISIFSRFSSRCWKLYITW